MNPYRSVDWKSFRAEVIRLDDGACVACGRTLSDDVQLHVHHKQYLPGHKPWEYPHDLCETLCGGCHAAQHGKIPPRFGWEYVGYEDLEDLVGECEYCGTSIRHVFIIQHENWRTMEVGEYCCDNLTCSQIASNHIESLRRFRERRKRFVASQRWHVDYQGVHRILQKKVKLEVVPRGSLYRLRMNERSGKKSFQTLIEAKAVAFDLIDSGVIDAYFSKHDHK